MLNICAQEERITIIIKATQLGGSNVQITMSNIILVMSINPNFEGEVRTPTDLPLSTFQFIY